MSSDDHADPNSPPTVQRRNVTLLHLWRVHLPRVKYRHPFKARESHGLSQTPLPLPEEFPKQLFQGDPEKNNEECVDLKAVAVVFEAGKEVRNPSEVGNVEEEEADDHSVGF